MVTADTCGRTRQSKASNWNFAFCYHIGTVFCPSDADVDTQGWFYVFACWVPAALVEQLQHGPTEVQIPRLTKQLPSPFFGFHTKPKKTSFSTGTQSYAVKSPSLAGVAVTVNTCWAHRSDNCRATSASCHLWMPPFYTSLMCKKLFGLSLGDKTLEGLNWSGMQRDFTSKSLFCFLTPFL